MRNLPVILVLLLFFTAGCLSQRVVVAPAGVRVSDPSFVRTVSGISGRPLLAGNSLQLVESGKQTFELLFDRIRTAKKSICIETYLWHDDPIGRQAADLLAKRAREGVSVKILIDAFGGRNLGGVIPSLLRNAGADVHFYHPFRNSKFIRYVNRTHRKLVIIDGEWAMTGGFGISDDWYGDESDTSVWRDIQVSMSGPAVFQAQSIFMENWLETTGEVLTGDRFFPELSADGDVTCRMVASSPRDGSSALQQIFLFAINSSERSFYMENAYFVPDMVTVEALSSAAQRGVDVRIIVPSLHGTDARAPIYAGRNYYGDLLRSGVKIYQYTSGKMHAKFAVVDGVWVTIGSTNFDNLSFKRNDESNLNIFDKKVASQLDIIFLRDLASSQFLDLVSFRRRPLSGRLYEFFYKFLEEQF